MILVNISIDTHACCAVCKNNFKAMHMHVTYVYEESCMHERHWGCCYGYCMGSYGNLLYLPLVTNTYNLFAQS